jgi:hypothetical protein
MPRMRPASRPVSAAPDRNGFVGTQKCAFTLDHYRTILTFAIDLGYRCVGCSEYLQHPSGKTLLLRHDVDLSLADAVRLMEVEASVGARSTFFIRVTASGYNVNSANGARHLRHLVVLGAELGLHYDVGRFPTDPHQVIAELRAARASLEAAAGVSITGGTIHMPRLASYLPTRAEATAAGLTYDPGEDRFNREAKFVSDSRRSWDDGCLCMHIGQHPKLYALIHPFWWNHPDVDVGAVLRLLRAGG